MVDQATKPVVVVAAQQGPIDLGMAAFRLLVVIMTAIPLLLTVLGTHDLLQIVAFFQGSDGSKLLGAVGSLIALGWGLYKSHKRGSQIAAVASDMRVPNSVAQIERPSTTIRSAGVLVAFTAALLGVMAMSLSSCQTVRTVDQAVSLANQNVGEFTVLDEKSWYYAEALYNVPAQAYLAANAKGLLHDPLKAQLKTKLQQLNVLRQAVYQAYKTGNAVSFHEKIAALKILSDQVRALIPAQQ